MIVATLKTGRFDFIALGNDRAHAERVMRKTWNAHRRDYGEHGGVERFEEWADEVYYTDLDPGTGLRDGEKLVRGQ